MLAALSFIFLVVVLAMAWLAASYRAADHSAFDTPEPEPQIADDQVSAAHNDVVARLNEFTAAQVVNVKAARQRLEDLFFREVESRIVPVDVDGVPGEWVIASNAEPQHRLLYLHGGAFRVGSPRSHRHLTNELSRRLGVAVLAIDYRMQPEHKILCCHEDTQTAYRWILENGPEGGGPPSTLWVAGDSAGGNLTLSVIAWARGNGLPAANGAIAFAPATDSTLSGPSWRGNILSDPFLGPSIGQLLRLPAAIVRLGSRFTSGIAPNHVRVSPLLGDLSDLPPTLLQASRDEMLYSDSLRYANKANSAGSKVTLQVWPKMVHVFQAFPELPEADAALTNVVAFCNAVLTANPPQSVNSNQG